MIWLFLCGNMGANLGQVREIAYICRWLLWRMRPGSAQTEPKHLKIIQ